MIRRPAGADHWILISQIAHARLAGQLAEVWRAFAFGDLEPRDQILAAIAHHDDGWERWDRQPGVADGRPISFLEMPLGEATAIWRASIERCREFGPAAGYVVAGHFCALLERFAVSRADSPSKRKLADAFLAAYRRRMENWLTELPESVSTPLARHGVAVLQMFDAMSLWLCCDERTKCEVFAEPGGHNVVLTPQQGLQVTAAPWPFSVDELELTVAGRQIPRLDYADDDDLAAAPSQPVELHFELTPKG